MQTFLNDSMDQYLNDIRNIKLLTKEEEKSGASNKKEMNELKKSLFL